FSVLCRSSHISSESHPGRCLFRQFFSSFLLRDHFPPCIRQFCSLGSSRSCPDHRTAFSIQRRYGTGHNRKICFCIPVRQIYTVCLCLFHDQSNQNIPVIRLFCELLQGNDSSMIQFHISIQSKKECQNI